MRPLKNWIEKNSQKTEIQKKGIALLLSFLITSFIFVIWIVTIINTSGGFMPARSQTMHKEVASPISSLMSNIRSVFGTNHSIDLK